MVQLVAHGPLEPRILVRVQAPEPIFAIGSAGAAHQRNENIAVLSLLRGGADLMESTRPARWFSFRGSNGTLPPTDPLPFPERKRNHQCSQPPEFLDGFRVPVCRAVLIFPPNAARMGQVSIPLEVDRA